MGRVEFVVFIAFNFEDAFLYHYQKFSELSPFLMFMFTHVLEKMSIQEQDKIEIERFKSFFLGAVVWSRMVAWVDVILGIPFLHPVVLVCCFTLNFFVHFFALASRMGRNIKNKLAKRSLGICLHWIVAWRYWWYCFLVFTRCTHPKLVSLTFERWGQGLNQSERSFPWDRLYHSTSVIDGYRDIRLSFSELSHLNVPWSFISSGLNRKKNVEIRRSGLVGSLVLLSGIVPCSYWWLRRYPSYSFGEVFPP